ncbi:MAG: hypothetical protein ACD_64C00252G0001 [uncultured bacterium]|nr:MAG: hypothetical protein ACD_64C00252G0001 [uncultured bacterium]
MKKYLAVFTAISLISTVSAFEDKQSLSRAERAFLITLKGVGTVGAWAGASKVGAEVGLSLLGEIDRIDRLSWKAKDNLKLGSLSLLQAGAGGAYFGYKGGKSLAILALAKFHGVSYRVEAISQYYNINAGQYKSILTAAATQDPEALLQAINGLYEQRFGENWKERLEKLFKKYRKRARILAKESSFNKKGNLKDFLRMVELGAAMANLYFKTNPNPEYTINSAIELYQELGLLK